MEQRNSLVVILLAALVGSAAIAPRWSLPELTPPSAALTQSEEGPARRSKILLRARNAKGLIEEFFSGRINPKNPSDSDDLEDEEHQALNDGNLLLNTDINYQLWKVDSLIATVPDPVQSGLGSVFDDYVDSIERAVSANGYVLDHFYNPWPSPEQLAKKAKGEGDSNGKDGASDDIQSSKQPVPIYELRPGLILFTDNKKSRLLVVFLVGETPTTGVHKSAFESALKQVSELPKYAPQATCIAGLDCQSEIKIIGPSYSGSATSIRLSLGEWLNRRLDGSEGSATPVQIISGSATTVSSEEFKDLNGVSYQAAIVSDISSMNALLSWLGGHDVAVLSEEDTTYGQGPSTSIQKRNRPPGLAPKLFQLQFPMHIAELQRAAERTAQTAKTGISTTPSLSNPNLPLDSKESRTRRDLLPLYSTAETNRQELILDANMRAINEHAISYVIITATDPADTLFLVHWIRQNCPKVTPVVLTADLLYLHSDVNADTRGMIVVSTYPLFLEDQLWTSPQTVLRRASQFSMDASEGIYNATLALLGGSVPMLDYAEPFPPYSRNPNCYWTADTHPLWISMVGGDQLWPVSIRDACIEPGYMVATGLKDPGPVRDYELRLYPKPFLLTSILIALVCFLTWSAIAANDGENLAAGFAPLSWLHSNTPVSIQQIFGDSVLSEYSLVRRIQVALVSIVLLGLLVTVACFFLLPLGTPLWRLVSLWEWATAAFVITLALCAWFASIMPSNWFANPPQKICLRLALWSILSLIGLIVLVVCGDPTKRLFLFLRTVELGSKVSPMVPMLLTYSAAIVLIFGGLRRHVLMESRQILTPLLGFSTESFSGVAKLECDVSEAVGRGAWSWLPFAIAIPIVIAYCLAFPLPQLLSHIDAPLFEFMFFIVSLAVYIGIGLALVRMIAIWLSMRTLLRRLYTHPSRYGYAGYRAALHMSPEATGDLFSKVPAMSQIEVALGQVRELLYRSEATITSAVPEVIARLKSKRPQLEESLPYVEHTIDSALQAEAIDDWREEIICMKEAEISMSGLSDAMAHIFEPLWRVGAVHGDSRHSKPPKGAKSIDEIGETYIASRVVDLLRHVMPQLETLATTTTLAMLLMLFAFSSYPFLARDDLLWFSWIVVLATVGSIMWMFFSLNRDRVASMIAGTTPGQTDWNSTLVLQVATHALIPVLVLLGAAFPAKLGTFVTWIGSLFGGHAA